MCFDHKAYRVIDGINGFTGEVYRYVFYYGFYDFITPKGTIRYYDR